MPLAPQTTPSMRVNIHCVVNNSAIRREKRNGKDYIIVPSATLPDDVVMNGIKYPATEIEKAFNTLDRTFAPLGHPVVNGDFVSAFEPEAINDYYVGAHNENVRRENGRVFLDKAIDVEVANRTEKGRQLLDAINKGEPIHTSTGVFLEVDEVNESAYKKVAKNLYFDHDAILIGEAGAATPEQGVGMMVNSTQTARIGNTTGLLVVNSYLENVEDEVEWAALRLVETVKRAEEAKQTRGLLDKFIALMRDTFASGGNPQQQQLNGKEGSDMPITEEQFAALEAKVTDLATNSAKVAETVAQAVQAAVKPLADSLAVLQANAKADEEKERAELTTKVVANGLLTEATAKGLEINALRELAAKQPGAAAPLFTGNGVTPPGQDPWKDYDFGVEKETE